MKELLLVLAAFASVWGAMVLVILLSPFLLAWFCVLGLDVLFEQPEYTEFNMWLNNDWI